MITEAHQGVSLQQVELGTHGRIRRRRADFLAELLQQRQMIIAGSSPLPVDVPQTSVKRMMRVLRCDVPLTAGLRYPFTRNMSRRWSDRMHILVDFLHWSWAFLPILALAFLLVQLRWTAQQAGPAGILIAAVVAFFAFKAPLELQGHAQAIRIDRRNRVFEGGAVPRGDGAAMGY